MEGGRGDTVVDCGHLLLWLLCTVEGGSGDSVVDCCASMHSVTCCCGCFVQWREGVVILLIIETCWCVALYSGGKEWLLLTIDTCWFGCIVQ